MSDVTEPLVAGRSTYSVGKVVAVGLRGSPKLAEVDEGRAASPYLASYGAGA